MAFLTETRVDRQPTKAYHKRLIVAIRIRPLKANETSRGLHSVDDKVVVLEELEVDNRDVLRQNRGSDRQFVFDNVFDEAASQSMVYELTCASLVQDVLHGYNATIFAYGPTGSGKTHTMVGTANDPGIMVRALNDLFEHVKHDTQPETINVAMSYIEIYNENVRDLLNPKNTGYLELREDNKDKTIHVVGLTEVSTSSTNEVMQLLTRGNKYRTVESTAANRTSSRSHALLSVTVRRTLSSGEASKLRATVRQGKLFMIDLAGSERASATKNRGQRLVEGAHINRSLLALGNCINALSGGARYVNYRDSKLTRLLKDALSGNCRTCMIAHVSPAAAHREESKNTLLYADRARNITNKVGQNVLDISYHVSQYRNIISELRDEISRLKTRMTEKDDEEKRTSVPYTPVNINQLPRDIRGNKALGKMLKNTDQMRSLKNEIVATFKEQMKLRKKLLNIDSYGLSLQIEVEKQHSIISEWEGRNNILYRPGAPDDRHASTADTSAHDAWEEIKRLEAEQEKCLEVRTQVQTQLEDCKSRAEKLEKSIPPSMTTEEERELLRLMVRCHELEVEKLELQSERIVKLHELQQRDLAILRYDRQRQICEEIITRQRQIMEEGRIVLPPDLQELYQLYQQELHMTSHTEVNELPDDVRKSTTTYRRGNSSRVLPLVAGDPLHSRQKGTSLDNVLNDSESSPSSAGSEWPASPLPAVQTPGTPGIPPAHVLFPPLTSSFQEIRSGHPLRGMSRSPFSPNVENHINRIPRL